MSFKNWQANVQRQLCGPPILGMYGQVILSVLTTGEDFGLSPMIHGLIRRYKEAEVPSLISSMLTETAV